MTIYSLLPTNLKETVHRNGQKGQIFIVVGISLCLLFFYDSIMYFLDENGFIGSSASSFEILNECANAVKNGEFNEGTNHWKFIGPNTGLNLISSESLFQGEQQSEKLTDDKDKKIKNVLKNIISEGSALSTIQRAEWYFGMSQEVDLKCLKANELYEVSMNVMIRNYENKPVICDPFRYFFDKDTACPTLALKLFSKDNELVSRPIARPVGPWNPIGWNQVYGIFEATPDLFIQEHVELYVTNAVAGNNEVIDNVVVKPISTSTYGLRTCARELIMNGDAQTEDARFWFLKGGGDAGSPGVLDIVSTKAPEPNADEKSENFAFYHHGDRSQWWNGMWQELDQRCLSVGSQWRVSYFMKIVDSKGKEVECVKDESRGCPGATIESTTLGKGTIPKHLKNTVEKAWKKDKWNIFEAIFVMTAEHKEHEQTWFYINDIEPGYGYIIDNISISPVSY